MHGYRRTVEHTQGYEKNLVLRHFNHGQKNVGVIVLIFFLFLSFHKVLLHIRSPRLRGFGFKVIDGTNY